MTSSRPLRSLGQNALLSLASITLTLGAAEGIARLLEPEETAPPVAAYITNWTQWEGDFYTVKTTALGWPPFEDYNQDGLRDRTHSIARPHGVQRLICLGDSVTAGYRIGVEEAYPQVLQDLLDAVGHRIEVFNVALGGWSTRQELIAYRKIARKYGPDNVLVGVCLNDIPELGNNLSRPPDWLTAFYRHSAVARSLVDASNREIRSIQELFEQPDSRRVRQAYERLFEDIRTLRDEVRADGAGFGVLVFPFRLQVLPGAPPPTPQQTLAAFCADEGIPLLDLLPALEATGKEAFVDYDHLSPLGHQVVADQILASALIAGPDAPRDDLPAASSAPRDSRDLAALVDSLTSPDPQVRTQAARALGTRAAGAHEALPALAVCAEDESAAVRAAAVWALGRIGPRPGLDLPVLEARLEDEDPAVRAGAAWSLGRLGTAAQPVAPALIRRLGDAEPEVRRRVGEALSRVRPRAETSLDAALLVLNDPQSPGRSGAARALGLMGAAAADAVPHLAAALSAPDQTLRQEAAGALGAIGPGAAPAVPALVRALDDPEVSWRVPEALGSIGPAAAGAVAALRACLRDERGNVRWRAAVALGKMGETASAAGPELARLTHDRQDNVRLGAVIALARVGADVELQQAAFVEALEDSNPEVRTKAANGLRRLGRAASAAAPALVAALADPDAWVRVSVARALGRVGEDAASVDALKGALDDDEEIVRHEAAAALRTLTASREAHDYP
ncbi:MAG: HEAT repeat domain-containing protein [Acidobacteria bacterium]|jgi:HEAT repeat protein/lysophospholipase L1-like esterase|nr:HEAT repeat domain-containing protein [Acidobacteriota bacterium]